MASKVALCAFNAGTYALLNYYSNLTATIVFINPNYIDWFERLNSLSTIFAISYFGYYFRLIVLNVENELEIEYQKTSEALGRLNEDLSDAVDYIKTILPEPLSEGSVSSKWEFIPSTSLGGDAFGYHWLDKDNFAIYLLDVSGHGVGAALLSATIMNVLRSHALPGVDFCEPDQVLMSLNKSFPEEENNNMFFTIWYGVYNRIDHYLLYSSGGHPPALLLQSSSIERRHMVQLKTRNCAVGVFENSAYKKDFQALKADSCLYVFSDGVYEFRHQDGSRWKYEEFANCLSTIHSGGNNDIDRLVKFAKNLNQSDVFEDDFTILRVSFNNV